LSISLNIGHQEIDIQKHQGKIAMNRPPILGYGEDALTLWALSEKLTEILEPDDSINNPLCKIIYRPSFGKDKNYGFGEFDFIILSDNFVYLGESKWDNTPHEEQNESLKKLEGNQQNRHFVFQAYLDSSYETNPKGISNWQTLSQKVNQKLEKILYTNVDENKNKKEYHKYACKTNSLLYCNLARILKSIHEIYPERPTIINRIIFFNASNKNNFTQTPKFEIISVNYSNIIDASKKDYFFELRTGN